MHPYNRRIEILLLCTANQCRSPMAEALLRDLIARAGVDATVSSAGLYRGGSPATGHAVETMAARGLDLGGHRSRQLGSDLLATADLVIGMARQHVLEAGVTRPDSLPVAFTLKELVRRGEAVGPRREGEPVGDWLRRVGAGRDPRAMLGVGHDPDLDVEDPVGKGRSDYEATAAELEHLLGRVVALVWPTAVPVGAQERKSTG